MDLREAVVMRIIVVKSGVLVLINYIIINHYFQHRFIMKYWARGFAGLKFFTDRLTELDFMRFSEEKYWKWIEK
jgi:hypothetical protein